MPQNITSYEPEEIDDIKLGLSEAASEAVPKAEKMVIDWINRTLQSLKIVTKSSTNEFIDGRQDVG